ncbi:restriction endonuclease subunit S [Actinomadura sp. NPDC000600]|uniref:restriction endonuclease subunit S n=1 Tax=Actinomadura sp. NPDC000600 TaxID=3154262 RepID=UPI003398B723
MTLNRTRLKFHLRSSDAGSWGDDPAGEGGVQVIRSTEITLDGRVKASEVALRSLSASEAERTKLTPGDLLVVRSSGSDSHLGKTGYVDKESEGRSFSNFLQRLRFKETLDSRFAWHFLNSTDCKQQIRQLGSTTTGLQNLGAALIGEIEIPSFSPEEQRHISDFLDAEIDRIDRFQQSADNQRKLIEERARTCFHANVALEGGPELIRLDLSSVNSPWKILPLNRLLTQLTNGYVGPTRDILTNRGIKYLQSLHIKGGQIDFTRRPYYVTPEWASARPRIRLRHHDVLIVQTGAIGEVAIVEDDYIGASCHALLIARTSPELLSAKYLWHTLRSGWGNQLLLREQTGALHPHLEAGKVRYVRLPIPPIPIQARVVARTEEITRDIRSINRALHQRSRLLTERRQALITAAVTGQFDVSTASGRGVTE